MDLLLEIHALKLSLVLCTGAAPEHWSCWLNVMLEKLVGAVLVTKLRAILLMEADFNFHNWIIFAKRMLDNARAHDLIPAEIYSEKGRTAEGALFQKVLIYNIARQWKTPLFVASIDAAQCYNRISRACGGGPIDVGSWRPRELGDGNAGSNP